MHSEDESALDHGGTTRERWDAERTTFQRVYDVLVGIREPASVAQFAQWADCSETGARSALKQLTEMGVAQRRKGRPTEYRRNDSYFRWRRIEDLARDHTPELRRSIDDLPDRDDRLQEEYGVPGPDIVTGSELVPEDHERLQEIRDDLTERRTIRRDIGVLRRAEQRATTQETDGVSA
jgi:predicted ArsR family transcriptional regulator